eukprot:g4679.t1
MSLSFLASKSWHTKNRKNVERVWEAEQEAEREKKKIVELQREIEEERRKMEMRKLQEDAGLISKTTSKRIDWMYRGGPQAEKGKEKEKEKEGNAAASVETSVTLPEASPTADTVDTITSSRKDAARLAWQADPATEANEQFRRLMEDPMMAVTREHHKRFGRSQFLAAGRAPRERRRRTKPKEKKKKKKIRKRKKLKEKKKKKDSGRRKKKRKRYRSSSSSSSGVSSLSDSSSLSSLSESSDEERHVDDKEKPVTKVDDDLGPPPEMLKRAKQHQINRSVSRDAVRHSQSQGMISKAEKLAQMKRDANDREEHVLRQDQTSRMQNSEEEVQGSSSASFLRTMQADYYMGDSAESLSQTLKRNSHYHQRGSDKANF